MSEIAEWIAARIPTDENVSKETMAALATEIGQERRLWEHLVRHDPGERVFEELYRDIHLDAWLCCWDNGQDTGFHDHDLSSGAVYTCDGELVEDRLVFKRGSIREEHVGRPAGSVFDFDAARVHCMRHDGGQPAASIHLYSPALWRMGFYSFDDDGNLCRASITYADEMWARPSGLADLQV